MVHHLYNVLFSEKYNLSTLHIQNLVYCLIMVYVKRLCRYACLKNIQRNNFYVRCQGIEVGHVSYVYVDYLSLKTNYLQVRAPISAFYIISFAEICNSFVRT